MTRSIPRLEALVEVSERPQLLSQLLVDFRAWGDVNSLGGLDSPEPQSFLLELPRQGKVHPGHVAGFPEVGRQIV